MAEFIQSDKTENLYEQLDCKIKDYTYVSFDLFDTLAFRTVNRPEDIYKLVGIKYREIYFNEIKNFPAKRIRAEQIARSQGKPEITIDDIYDIISIKDDTVKFNLKKLEKETEIQSIVPHKGMVEIAKRCKERGQKIIITTDMYLDRATISAILNKIGVDYDALFISGEAKCTKLSGKLFPFILERLNIGADEIIHIGDDGLKDVLHAEQNGINALQSVVVPCRVKTKEIIPSHFANMVQRRIENYPISNDIPFNLGYSVLGPFLVEFCKWVNNISRQNNTERLVFVAREGYIIKKVYDKLYPQDEDKSKYICLNKNLLRFPILYKKPTVDSFLATLPNRPEFTLSELFYYFKVNDDEKQKFKELYAYDSSDDYEFLRKNMFSDNRFGSCFEILLKIKAVEIETQYNRFLDYIGKNELTDKKILLVNNSFEGNGQNLLCELFDLMGKDKKSVESAQFACSYRCYAKNEDTAFGWLNDIISDYAAYDFAKHALIFEHLLFEPVGTALQFGESGVTFENRGKECENDKVISEIQNYVLEFVEDNNKNVPISFARYAIKNMMRLFKLPTLQEVSLIGNLYDYDSDGEKTLIDTQNVKLGRGFEVAFQITKFKNVNWRQGVMRLLKVRNSSIKFYNFLAELKLKNFLRSRGTKN